MKIKIISNLKASAIITGAIIAFIGLVAVVNAAPQTQQEAEIKLLTSMKGLENHLIKTMAKWATDVKTTSDGDEIRLISIKAMGPIVEAIGKVVKETLSCEVDSDTKEKVVKGLSEQLTKITELKATFEKEQARQEELNKLFAENDAAIKKLDKDIKQAMNAWLKKNNIPSE
ncbi:MAG: hypothetical protein EXS46_03435 [Candidatus Taylorbacteria bacterium]|nr:hypothetical protein [Candidatus Taylorbacteria bacterium]